MTRLTVAGIPIHPLLNLPLAALALAGMGDLVVLLTGSRSWARTAYQLQLFGVLGGVLGGVPGLLDYASVVKNKEAKPAADLHAVLNAVLLLVSMASFMLRRRNPEAPSRPAQLISILSVPAWLYSGLQGSELASRFELDFARQQAVRRER